MTRLLLLARGDHRSFRHLDGRPITDDLPFAVTVLADRECAKAFAPDGDRLRLELVRWSEPAAVERAAAALHAETPFVGVAALDETLITLAGAIRERLGLAGMDEAQTERFRDKRLMKEVVGAAGVRVPEHARCENRAAVEAVLARHDRIVVKPFDGLGSRGVEFIDDLAGLDAWYAATRDPRAFQAEEYVEGTLYHVNAVVLDGRAVLTASAPYLPGMANIDFATGAPFVSVLLEPCALRDRLTTHSDAVIAALGMANGVTHLECFVTASDEIIFCEIGARPGGGGIVYMIELQHDVHFGRALMFLEAGMGNLLPIPDQADRPGVAGLIGFRWPTSGFVRGIAATDRFADPWIRHYAPVVAVGDFVPACAHCTDYVGLTIIKSDDFAQFEARRADIHDRFYDQLVIEAV